MVLVMFIVLLLTILGVTVLSATIGGARRAETRENDVQSLHLAQKSIDEAIAYITADLNQKIQVSSNTTQAQFDQEIEMFLRGLNSNKGAFVTDTSLQGASNEITGITLDGSSTSSKHVVAIKANATVNGVLRTLQQKVVITTFPDFLNYSLGSEGTIYLNGAPYIQGNIYAGNQLKVSQVAKYKHNAELEKRSLFSLIDGEAHIQSMNDLLYSRTGDIFEKVPTIDDADYSSLDNRVKTIIEKAKIKKNTTFVQVSVEDSFLDKVAEASGSAGNKKLFSEKYYGAAGSNSSEEPTARGTRLITSLQQPGGISNLWMPMLEDFKDIATGDTDEEKEQEKHRLFEEAKLSLKQNLERLERSTIFIGNLKLDGVMLNQIRDISKLNSSTGAHWLIVNGDLTIDSYSTAIIQSNILVTGNLYIRGKAEFDSTMFVLGKTDIVDATISGIPTVGRGSKELVLISKGGILINRVEEFKNEATRLRAFFYTDSTAELYGVGSIFSLDGGFFAKGDLIINAVVGKVKKETGSANFNFDIQTEVESPRFIVNYNEQVFEDQNVGLPRVNQINVHVGPIELLTPGK
ncbi:hypothetical protein NYE25_18710 [Paenibacillus sp. FSL E2-8871]|uniref:hypothetical protein n=1 Tax=Paenibacillus sp. FSL E2-8871 TaxID=2975326 RepID=UPI0030F8901C